LVVILVVEVREEGEDGGEARLEGVAKGGLYPGVGKSGLAVEGAGGRGDGRRSGGQGTGEVEAGEEGLVVAVVEVRVYEDSCGVMEGEGGGGEEHVVHNGVGEAGGGWADAGVLWGG